MTYPTIKGTSWLLMREDDPVPVQNFGRTSMAHAIWKAQKYVQATPGQYSMVRIEHVEREAERFPVPASSPSSRDGGV